MNRRQKEHCDALRKRMDWLKARIESGEREGKVFTYDKQEHSALDWALGVIAEHYSEQLDEVA